MVSTIDANPLALVGDRFSFRPICSRKPKSSPAISSALLPEYTLMRRLMIPFVIMASLSAVNMSFPF
jgi:hypothetical protein